MSGAPVEANKKRCIDDIINHMTADFQSYEGHFFLGSPGPPPGPQGGSNTPPGGVWAPQVPQSESLFYPAPPQPRTNFVNLVVPGYNGQEYQQQQPLGFIHYAPPPQNMVQPHIFEYQRSAYQESIGNGCLIENVVGNWVPNRNGTYSPFGGIQADEIQMTEKPQPAVQPPKKRIVAEVKPMRPTYSDVLAKSPPLTPPPVTKISKSATPVKPDVKKVAKTSNPGKARASLKRQNSSGSEETLAEKTPPVEPQTSKVHHEKKSDKKSKKKTKTPEKDEKSEQVFRIEQNEAPEWEEIPSIGPNKPNFERTSKPKSDKKTTKERNSSSARAAKNKRSQRSVRKRDSTIGSFFKKWQEKSSYYLMFIASWLIDLLWNVTSLSTSLLLQMFTEGCEKSSSWFSNVKRCFSSFLKKYAFWSKKETKFAKKPSETSIPGSLAHNIQLPTTGEEAMKRLLSCKGKDPYSILGVTSSCTDEEIKRYYKSQALLVHPDKNSQPGAEEAFKILVHAFDLIAEPEKRAAYDRYVAETNQVEQAWSELSNLLSQLHEKMEYAANTIRCNNCGKRHKRELTERPSYAARYCATCKIRHSARESDMWAESRGWGWWRCRYFACMDGAVYDITQWANCQGNAIQRVKPDSHDVQYRVLLGRDHQPPPEPDIDDILNSLFPQDGAGRSKKKSKKNK